jgi:hypothetical protein
VLRAPVEGSVPDKIDDGKAKAVAGVIGWITNRRCGKVLDHTHAVRKPDDSERLRDQEVGIDEELGIAKNSAYQPNPKTAVPN